MKLMLATYRDLIRKYVTHFRYAWSQRAAMNPPPRSSAELDFLPAALALQEKPVHPAPRVTMYLIMGFGVLALVWAIVGKVDIVAVASGTIIPDDRTKVIQPLDTARVRAIHVRDGQTVRAGDILLELDATTAQADADRTRADWQQAQLDVARARALLEALKQHAPAATMEDPLKGTASDKYVAAQQFLDGEYSEYRSKLAQLSAQLNQHQAERAETLENLNKLQETLPIVRQREDDFRSLLGKHYIARHEYLDKEQARIEMERDLGAAKAKLATMDAVILATRRQRDALTAQTRRSQLDQLHEARRKAAEYKQEFIKTSNHRRSMTLRAPVDGTVQQLVVHTVGGVVTPAQQLMVIVPKNSKLEVEALVKNKDIGFVNAGQTARVKVETFPYTQYGTIQGKVVHVSSDAIEQRAPRHKLTEEGQSIFSLRDDENLGGMGYSARIQLERGTMPVDDKSIKLSPGMAVTVEIKTGKRRLINYFLSPLIQYRDESLRGR